MAAQTMASLVFDHKENMTDGCYKSLMDATAELEKTQEDIMTVEYVLHKIHSRSMLRDEDLNIGSSRKRKLVRIISTRRESDPQDIGSLIHNYATIVKNSLPEITIGETFRIPDGEKVVHVTEDLEAPPPGAHLRYVPTITILSVLLLK